VVSAAVITTDVTRTTSTSERQGFVRDGHDPRDANEKGDYTRDNGPMRHD